MRQVLGAGALWRPRGMGWRGRWEGRSGWGTHVNPWLIHVNVWQKPLQYCKVISLQSIKINGGKKRKKKKDADRLKIREWTKTYHKMSNRKKVYSQRSISSSRIVLQRGMLRSWESDSAFMSPVPGWIFQVPPFPSHGKEGRVCLCTVC